MERGDKDETWERVSQKKGKTEQESEEDRGKFLSISG